MQNKKREKALWQLKKIQKLVENRDDVKLAAEWHEPWKSLISTILSSQTKDETTIKISNILYKKYPTLKHLAEAELSEIKRIIRPINFYKTKSKHILQTSRILINTYRGKIPNSREKLMELPGVGRKVANVYLVEIHNAAAIGVDTHVSFLAQVLKWSKNKNPHKIEKDLERLFPKKYWNSINYILVRFGRIYNTRKRQVEKLRKEKII
jgi:endonuclease III